MNIHIQTYHTLENRRRDLLHAHTLFQLHPSATNWGKLTEAMEGYQGAWNNHEDELRKLQAQE